MGEHCLSLRRVKEPTLVDMEAWLHDKIKASTDPYLLPKLPKQNQHHSKQGYKCNQNTGVHTAGINSKKEANRLKTNVYFVENNIEFTSVKGTKP